MCGSRILICLSPHWVTVETICLYIRMYLCLSVYLCLCVYVRFSASLFVNQSVLPLFVSHEVKSPVFQYNIPIHPSVRHIWVFCSLCICMNLQCGGPALRCIFKIKNEQNIYLSVYLSVWRDLISYDHFY